MSIPAARINDMHVCPAVNPGPSPHVGGPIVVGSPNVIINSLPAARAGDMATCSGPPDTVVTGSSSVFINNKPAARLSDSCAHGGKIVAGSPTVFVGTGGAGGATGVTLGNPSAALVVFNGLANTRTSGSTQQSYGNCGVESSRQILDAQNINTSEDVLLDYAIANNYADNSAYPSEKGGTSSSSRQSLLKDAGVTSDLVDPTMDNIAQAVADGKGVITSNNAGILWNDPDYRINYHAVVVTGMEYDNSGNIDKVIINDTGTGEGSKAIPKSQFENSLEPGRPANITEDKIW